jgi:hypothetical protein
MIAQRRNASSTDFVVHGVSVAVRFLSRETLAVCRAELSLKLDRTTDESVRNTLRGAIEDVIRQDAVQAMLNIRDRPE